jgi:D-psicose/D-tagatose/L-ribulose 3-epimerase
MQQIGCHGLVWTGTFDSEGFDRAARMTLAAGFDLLELPLLDPYSFDLGAAKATISKYNVAISASLGQSPETDISSEDASVVAAGEDKLNRAVDILGELGSQYFVGVLYSQLAKYAGPATGRGRANSMDVLRRVADRAQKAGIKLGLEVVNRYETNIMNTARQAITYLDELGHDNVGVHLDTYHMNIEESDMFLPVLVSSDRLCYVHIGESHRGYLGSGTVDFDSFFRALNHIGYTGPITFESFSTAVVNEELSRALAVWRNLWDDSADLGAHANTFIRNKLRAVETIELH